MILAQAGRFGGWSLYLKDGKPTYSYNWLGMQEYTVAATEALPAGKSTIRFNFVYDGGGLSKGGTMTISVNGKQVASGRIEKTQGMAFSADEGADVGEDSGTAVAKGYEVPFKFNGKIGKVTIELGAMPTASAIEADTARKHAALKIGLSN